MDADILVVGSGAAGLSAAVHAAMAGANVLVIDKGIIGKSGSTVSAVQSAAAGKWSTAQDSLEAYCRDLLASGKGLSDPQLVHTFVDHLERVLDQLIAWGLQLDRDASGEIVRTEAAGHAFARSISAAGGNTGRALLKTLIRQANRLPKLGKMPFTACVQLLVRQQQISGALVYDLLHNRFRLIRCKSLILATGGIGQLYHVTTNPQQATADGFALALRAGVRLIDMEQVQFYPTSLVVPHHAKGFCLSFYHFAKVYNARAERIMQRYDPVRLENVPRDAICYAIAKEIREGRCTPQRGLLLDVSEHVQRVRTWFPHEYKFLRQLGIRLEAEPVEIAPAAHFMMGGARINRAAMTHIEQLYAVGETAGGLHGANRLANNALPECLVFGAIAGESAARYARTASHFNDVDGEMLWATVHRYEAIVSRGAAAPEQALRPFHWKQQIQRTMTEHVSVLRDESGLRAAEQHLRDLSEQWAEVRVSGFPHRLAKDFLEMLEVENMLLTARAIAAAARAREETRGAHVRLDHPDSSPQLVRVEVQQVEGRLEVRRQLQAEGGNR